MKKAVCFLLAAILTVSLAGCGSASGSDAESASAGKVAILTSTVSQGEENYQGAMLMKEEYGDRVIVATYPDNFAKEVETTISDVLNLVSDPDVKALVFDQSITGATAAIKKALEINPDLLVLFTTPGEDPSMQAEVADIILCCDEIEGVGNMLPAQAAKLGAKTFIHYSFPRHMSMVAIAARHDLLKANCEALGITFVDVTAPDPQGDAGFSGTQQFILEDVPREIEKYGKDTAFYATNTTMQEPLIKAVCEGGAIFPQSCGESPLDGFPNALGIQIPEDKASDIPYIIGEIQKSVAAYGMTGRISTWPVAVNMAMIEACTDYAIDWIDSGMPDDGRCDMEKMTACLNEAADGETVYVTNFVFSGYTFENMFAIRCDYLTF